MRIRLEDDYVTILSSSRSSFTGNITVFLTLLDQRSQSFLRQGHHSQRFNLIGDLFSFCVTILSSSRSSFTENSLNTIIGILSCHNPFFVKVIIHSIGGGTAAYLIIFSHNPFFVKVIIHRAVLLTHLE